MLSVVVNPYFDWGNDRPPQRPYHETVIYEAHVKGLTMTHPALPDGIRGTYAGIAHPAMIEHLTKLGITAIELMPVQQFVHDSNYWGYNTIGFFAPHNAYSSAGQRGEQVPEFKTMVQALHEAGIEVILDVVYNHTAEGNQFGPTLCFKGIDNAAYYRLVDGAKQHYYDTTGTGNSLLMRHPHVLQLQFHEVDRLSVFFDLVQQDPVVSQVKLIAEPWDLGDGGYQVGNFPPLWTEWNGRYRDTVRDFWRGEPGTLAEFGSRLTGSSDLYQDDNRRPIASINFVTAHDGFTLRDLVSYNEKHNEANGENNSDGESHNRSWNCGVEGETDDPQVNSLRARQQRNLPTTLLVSQGVPMILYGDELGRTQRGNNNAYCQDNELSWINWNLDKSQQELLEFTRRLVHLRHEHPVLRRRRFFRGTDDIAWFAPDGKQMTEQNWLQNSARTVMVFLNGDAIAEPDPRGERTVDDSLLVLFNCSAEPIDFVLPPIAYGAEWRLLVDTSVPVLPEEKSYAAEAKLPVAPRGTVILIRPRFAA